MKSTRGLGVSKEFVGKEQDEGISIILILFTPEFAHMPNAVALDDTVGAMC